MDKSPEKVQQWFEAKKDKVLKITKVEDGDHDLATIKLKDVNLVRHEDYDDYLSSQALLLLGEGTVATGAGREMLPYETFEIALTDQWTSRADENSLHLQTERGSYTIELDSHV